MRITTFDPGESTGVCQIYFDMDHRFVLRLQTIPFSSLESFCNQIFFGDIIVVERIASNGDPNQLVYEKTILRSVCDELTAVEKVSPGLWKPVAKARAWKCRSGSTQHEKDAYTMARYWFWYRMQMDIGDIT